MSDTEGGQLGEPQLQDVDEDVVLGSQGLNVIPSIFSAQEEDLQSSCETLLSQQSQIEEPDESQVQEVKVSEVSGVNSTECSDVNSSLEGNTSVLNGAGSFIQSAPLEEQLAPDEAPAPHAEESQAVIFEEEIKQDVSVSPMQLMRKRKERTNDSTPSPKKLRKEHPVVTETTEEKPSPKEKPSPQEKPSPEIASDKNPLEVSVMEISSTPEHTIVLDDSQEFSLRIEDSSPPVAQTSGDKSKDSQGNPVGKDSCPSNEVKENVGSPEGERSLSQKSTISYHSHTNNDQNLSWGSHKDIEERKAVKEKIGAHVTRQSSSDKDSSSESARVVNADNLSRFKEITEDRLCAASITWIIDETTNQVVSAKIRKITLADEAPADKAGRMSLASTTSAKSSSSAGSVGLPGPFPLPGRSRLSVISTVSSSSSGSSASNQAWDGPFLKPSVPGSKPSVAFSCEKCGYLFPSHERSNLPCPVMNGVTNIVEREEPEAEPLTPKRVRKGSQSSSGVSKSSGLLEEETSSSGSLPQASSTPTPRARGRPRKQQNGSALKTQRNGTVSPTDEQKNLKSEKTAQASTKRSLNRSKPTKSSTSSGPPPSLTEKGIKGQAVLARWGGDGRYYPGWIAEPLTAQPQVLVHFCDGPSKPTATTKVLRAEVISPGTLVLAATASGEYEEALVVQVNSIGSEPVYVVERDKTTREVKFPNIALLETTVSELTLSEAQKVAASVNFNDLSLENIIAHPRKRSVRTPGGEGGGGSARRKKRQTTPQPCTSHGRTFEGPDECYADTDSSTHSTCSIDLRGREIKPLDIECSPPESNHVKLVYNRRNMTYKKREEKSKKEERETDRMLGPIPKPGSQLFVGCIFLITYTPEVELLKKDPGASSGIEDSNGDVSQMSKERLRMQIKNGGGKVCNSFSEVPKEELRNTYLITDKQCNTPLYLQCLVNNIPIYSNTAVIQCCTQNRPWKDMIAQRGVRRMMAGYSLSKHCLVNPRSSQPLRGKTLLLALSGDPSLATFWEGLVLKVGGTVEIYRQGCLGEKRFDVIVTDTDCDRELVMEACSQSIPLVSMTWLQQCIITGEFRPPVEHPAYKYNTSSGESPEY